MSEYAAFLGHQPRISIAELAAVIPDFTMRRQIGGFALFETTADLQRQDLRTWGGIVVLAKKLTSDAVGVDDVPQILKNELKARRGKVTFSIRTFGIPPVKIRELYRASKQGLKDAGIPSRYVGSERAPAPTALLRDSGVLDEKHGCELLILLDKEDISNKGKPLNEATIWIGRTIAAQDPNAYAKRDMEKPVRDTRVGLLPPKLAQVMLNFGRSLVSLEKKESLTVFDPFCGTGVIPMEALLRGWNVCASDASQKAVSGCEKNLEWLRKEEKILKKDVLAAVWKQDACKPFDTKSHPELIEGKTIIVTETTLGPPMTSRATHKDAMKLCKENETVQAEFLRNVAASLPGVPVVCTWPVWYLRTGPIFLEKVWTVLGKLGYTATLPPGIEPDIKGRLSLLYRRPDQFVGREIVLLLPKRK